LGSEDADDQAIRHVALRAPSGRDRRDVRDDDPRLGQQPELEAKLGPLRRREQRPLAELLGQHDRDDDVVTFIAQAFDLGQHDLLRVGSGGPDVEPGVTARELEPARVDARIGVLPRDVEGVEAPAAHPAGVPDRPFGGDVERFGVDEHPVLHAGER